MQWVVDAISLIIRDFKIHELGNAHIRANKFLVDACERLKNQALLSAELLDVLWPAADFSDGSCEPYVSGCTDSGAANFDPEASVEDGSCIFVVHGCTDSAASTYPPAAHRAWYVSRRYRSIRRAYSRS